MKKLIIVFTVLLVFGLSSGLAIARSDKPVKQIQTTITVTSTASIIVTENPSGADIFIQNNDAADILYLNLSGTATAAATMIVIGAGESINLGYITNAISAISSSASNANICLIKGL